MSRSVLVTGATGLIGRQTVHPLLDAGFDVTVLSRSGDAPAGTTGLACDILDENQRRKAVETAKATHLLHLAWHDSPTDRWTADENFHWADATVALVRDFKDVGGKRAVCVGSCAEYDWSYEVLRETTPLNPSSVYGKAKVSAASRLLDDDAADIPSLAWARIFFCYGPGEPRGRLLGDLIYGLSEGEIVACTDGRQERDYLHTADIGRALVTVLDSDLTGPVNIGSGQSTRVRDLITATAEYMGRPDLIALGQRPRPDDDPARLVADIARLNELGFTPEFDLQSGIRDCVDTHLRLRG